MERYRSLARFRLHIAPGEGAPYHAARVASYIHYAQIQRLLSQSRAVSEPAEAHGTLTGALCAMGAYRFEDWLAEILPEGPASGGDAAPSLRSVYDETRAALMATQMEFELLLPDDDESLQARTEALALWCNGFIYGLGAGGHTDPERLPGDAGEIVRDLAQIMRAGVDGQDDLESNETALAELVEFVRVGVQVVYEELGTVRPPSAPPGLSLH